MDFNKNKKKPRCPNQVEELDLESRSCKFDSCPGHQDQELTGDCCAVCLNCFGGGPDAIGCICGNPRLSMCYSVIQEARKKAKIND